MTTRTRTSALNATHNSETRSEEASEERGARGLVSATVVRHSRKARVGSAGGSLHKSSKTTLLSEDELTAAEQQYESGITAVEIVELFVSREIRFSEATFRKYVQQGLLPRSRRVGRKGKHRGSLGVYPAKVVRRINRIKTLMQAGYTIEEIQTQFLQFADVIEGVEEGIRQAFDLFQTDVAGPRFDSKARKSITREILEAEKCAEELLSRINGLSERFAQSRGERYQSSSAAGSAEDLL